MACEEALKNPLILQQIFKNFPTKFLLSPCSFVNKIWNRETRKFIRDYRKCMAHVAGKIPCTFTACQRMQQLDQQCVQIIQEGRLIPWNGLYADFSYCYRSCLERFENGTIYCSLASEFKLKYLEIVLQYFLGGFSADHIPLLLLLLRDRGAELKSLTVSHIEDYDEILNDVVLQFPQLEEFKISKANWCSESTVIQMILDNAPKLSRIYVRDPFMLEMFTEEKYGLLEELKLEMNLIEDENLCRRLIERQPQLRILSVTQPRRRYGHDTDDDEMYLGVVRLRFNCVLEELLRCSHHSLHFMFIKIEYPLEQLSPLPLVNLEKLKIQCGLETGIFWGVIASIDFFRIMPVLEQVEIIFDRSKTEWPIRSGRNDVFNTCRSVRTLKLGHCAKRVNVNLLHSVFPNVENLEFSVTTRWADSTADPPLKSICKLWPKLRELKFGERNQPKRNFDSDFCGIFEQEARWLRKMDEEYLRAVHIVPIRPCFLTMSDLRVFSTHFQLWRPDVLGEPTPDFISDVTKFLVLKRMPQLDNSVTWEYEDDDSD